MRIECLTIFSIARSKKTLSEILKLYDGHGGHVTVFDVDPIILEELKRRDYLNYLDFNLSGNAVVVPSYKAITYKFNQNKPSLVSTRRSKVFETFTESYTRVKSIGNGGRAQYSRSKPLME